MKRLLINIAIFSFLAGIFGSCKKTLDSQFYNPDQPTTASMGGLLTGMEFNNRIHSSYYDYYTFIMSVTAPFSQMVAVPPGTDMYTPNLGYIAPRWTDYYAGSGIGDYNYSGPGIMSNFREMQTAYAALAPAEQAEQYIFLQAANVIVCDQTAQMIDLFGDIPFFQANSLNITREAVNAPFDDAATIYDTLINNLDQLNNYFATTTLSSSAQQSFTTQDKIYGGNMDNWRRYANSLRLRLLMRISNVNPTAAQTKITAMLNNPNTYPLITDNSQNALLNQSPTTLISDIQGAISSQGPYSLAPAYLLDTIMKANGDPRLSVYWDLDSIGGYAGISAFASSSQFALGISNHTVSPYDSATFIYNYAVPGVLFTAAETDFLVAEADVRWGLGDGGANAYYNGITQSINFYYGLNQTRSLKPGSGNWSIQPTPSADSIARYEAQPAIAFASSTQEKLAQIYTQKWESFFILQAQQAWAEYRRTGYPKLNFYNYSSVPSGKNALPPNRLLYPAAETEYNTYYINDKTLQAKDTWNTKIFWDVN